MKKMRRFTAFLLIITTIFSMNIMTVLAEEDNGRFTSEFIVAADDTIVCYMDGVPIKKAYINEYGVVTQESLEQAKAEYEGEIRMTRATPTSVYMTLPTWANNAIVKTSLAAPRYGQTNIYYYFTKDNANIYAMSLDTGSTEGLLALLGGFIPKVGPVIAIMFTVSSLSKGEIATKIRNLTNANKKVRINCATSSFGTFYGVFEWTGRTIETHKIYDSGTTETVTNLQFKE